MNKKEFTLTMIREIKKVAELGFHYQAFILIACFNNYCRNELGLILFDNPKINKGLDSLTTIYRPNKTIWLTDREHLKDYRGTVKLDINETINYIESKINGLDITEEDNLFLEITED